MDEDLAQQLTLDGIVTVVDAKHIEQHLDEEKPEGVENEVRQSRPYAVFCNPTSTLLVTYYTYSGLSVDRLQSALKLWLNRHNESLSG